LQTINPLSWLAFQVTGKCGSVRVRLIPAPRGTGIVSAPVPKKLLQMAGIDDCYTSARGATATLGNFGKYLGKKLVVAQNLPSIILGLVFLS
jgi:ribosomal protein S5